MNGQETIIERVVSPLLEAQTPPSISCNTLKMWSVFLFLAELAFGGHFWRNDLIVLRVCGELLMALQPLTRTCAQTARGSRPAVFKLFKGKRSTWVNEAQTFRAVTFNLKSALIGSAGFHSHSLNLTLRVLVRAIQGAFCQLTGRCW